ncbi:hypothetical protein SLEP1_g21172 [Rubroshorea leprosula]|uniref:non-specific serine/threonine protein kinase n=1 Tax=Rubroshorea leprosula TaxID=152421 RepID=A0AAV5JH32_9ROSI|nr:hypothetical protein SLEP1_g21172 [Rubroshorea leprosula]
MDSKQKRVKRSYFSLLFPPLFPGTYIPYQFLFSLQCPDQPLLEIHPSIPPVPHPHPFKNMNYFLLFVMILSVFSETPLSSSNPDLYGPCSKEFKCGNVSAGFPFWGGEDQRPHECGHPGLQLQCEDNHAAILEIVGVPYRVLDIKKETKILKIAREDYEGGICRQNIQNTNLDPTLFVSAPGYVNITLLYDCPMDIPTLKNFTCSFNGINSSKNFIHPGPFLGPMICSASASVLVHEPSPTVDAIEQSLKDGFEVKWKVDDEGRCPKCLKSKGSCGIDPGNKTVCHCQEPGSSFEECPIFPLPPGASQPPQPPSNANKRGKYLMSSIENVSYPFWGVNRADYCGQPGFELDCQNDVPKIKMLNNTFRVLGINTEQQILKAGFDLQWEIGPQLNSLASAKTSPGQAHVQDQPASPQAFTMLPLVFLFPPIFLLSAHGTHSSAQNDTSAFPNCNRTFSCGGLPNLSYPFTGGPRPTYCGPPGFLLTCTDDGIPQLIMDSLSYKIIQVDRSIQSMTLSRSDLYNNTCVYPQNLFWCGFWNSSSAAYHVLGPVPNDPIFKIIRCNISIKLPMLQAAADKLETNRSTLREALMEGFSVIYTTPNEDDCVRCRDSSGECGFSDQFVCICGDRICDIPGKKKILLITAGGVIACILLGVWCLLWIQRRKRIAAQSQSKDWPATPPLGKGLDPTTPSTTNSESIPSYPSAMSDIEKGSTYFGVQVFSYAELEKATDNFDPSKELGEGGFGTVYHGVLSDGHVVAVKRLFEKNLKRVEQFINEIKILADIRHPNLVTLYGCTSRHSRELLLVYEYIPNGTVADHLHGRRAKSGLLTWPVRLRVAIESANALAYLHGKEIIHRDVKTSNILLDNSFHVKVADFGLSRLFPNDVTHVSTAPQGTPGYVDPEYYQCYHLTDKSDVYSFGVVLIELISAKQAVDTNRHHFDINLANMVISRIQNQALHELVDPPLAFETDFAVRKMVATVAELAFQCLQQERDMRPSMEEVLGDDATQV